MIKTVRCAPAYSIILVEDVNCTTALAATEIDLCVVTPECIAVACLAFCDGETTVMIGPALEVANPGYMIADSVVVTPSGTLAVRTVEGDLLIDAAVASSETRIRVWTNALREPDVVAIGIVT